MSSFQFRKDPLEDSIIRESQASGIHSPERQCYRSGRRQPTCMTNHLDEFLLWVAYDRNLAGPHQITGDESLRCPMLGCRRRCDDQNKLMEHVFRCAPYSDGMYWCFHCKKEESFASSQLPFRKERLSVKVKRLFRSLGAKSHQKDHEALEPPAAFKGTSGISNRQYSEYLPQNGGIMSVAVEMDHEAIDSPAAFKGSTSISNSQYSEYLRHSGGIMSVAVEMDHEALDSSAAFKGSTSISNSQYSEYLRQSGGIMPVTVEMDHKALDSSAAFKGSTSISNSQYSEYLPQNGGIMSMAVDMADNKLICELEPDYVLGPAKLNGGRSPPVEHDSRFASLCPVCNKTIDHASQYANMEDVRMLPLPSSDIREPPNQFHVAPPFKIAIPEDSLPQFQSPVSSQSAHLTSTSYVDALSESPTGTEFSGLSLISTPSTRNSTRQSSSQSSLTKSFESDISPPSTRNSTMQSSSQSSLTNSSESDVSPPSMLNGTICIPVFCQLYLDPGLQNERRIEGISAMSSNLDIVISGAKQPNSDGDHLHQTCIGHSSSSFPMEQEISPLDSIVDGSAVDGISQSDIIQTEFCHRSAKKKPKRKRLSNSSSALTPDAGPSLSSSASSNTLADSSKNEYSRCSICDFQPTGVQRYHKRTMKRHFRSLHDPDYKEVYACSYEGCKHSYNRADNLTAHVRRTHLRTKRQRNSDVNLGTGDAKTSPKSNRRSGSQLNTTQLCCGFCTTVDRT